jgi:hypothetical protein
MRTRTPKSLIGVSTLALFINCGDNLGPDEDTVEGAAHAEVSLPGSEFEIDLNANLKVDDAAPSIDWASVTENRKADLPSGAGDDSFGEGTKEDTPVPTIVDGSIPPNKSDLKTFGVYFEDTPNGEFLHMYWHRVQEPTGTTNMDFEFNKSTTISSNGKTPVRSAGDVLIQYDLARGGTRPELFLSRWVTSGDPSQCEASNSVPCWSTRENLTAAGDATGSINTSAIAAADSDGLGAISARTFGEASIDFTAITGGGCNTFGSAYLKSRSSDSFTAAVKDFIEPVGLTINACGAIKVTKTRKHAATGSGDYPHAGVAFTVNGVTQQTDSNGVTCFDGLMFAAGGTSYTVTETVPTGYAVVGSNPVSVTVDNAASCGAMMYTGETVAFQNMPLTNIKVLVDSQIDGGTASVITCGTATANTDSVGDGSLEVNNLQPGTVNCSIVIDP